MNLFSEPQANLFSSEQEPSQQDAPSNPEVTQRTAQMAAFAGLNVSEEAGNIFQSMLDRTALYEAQIQAYGDSEARLEAAARAKEVRLQNLAGIIGEMPEADPELTKGAILAYQEVAAADEAEDARYALEQQSIENIQNLAAAGDMTQARVMLSNLENGSALDVVRDYNAKQLMLQAQLDKAQVAVEDQGWMASAVQTILQMIPFEQGFNNVGNVPIAEKLENWYDMIFSGESVKNQADSLWDMPIKEFSQFVNEELLTNIRNNAETFGFIQNNKEELRILSELAQSTPSALETNAWAALDVAGLVPVGALSKVGKSLPALMIRNGASRESAELVAKAALDVVQDSASATGRLGMSTDDVVDSLGVAAINPTGGPSRAGIAMTADEALQRGRVALDERLGDLERTSRMAPEEINHAVSVITERLSRQYDREIKNVNVVGVDLPSGSTVNRVEFMLGKKSGNGFANEGLANRYLNSIGEAGEVIQDESGQWFAKVTIDMPEEGFYTNLLSVKTPNPLRFVLNARNIGDTNLADAAQVAGNKRNAILASMTKQFHKTFRSLGPNRDAFAQVWQRGETMGTWFTEDQLGELYNRAFKRNITPQELTAYREAREINDIEYLLRNEDIYRQRLTKGYRTASFDTGRGVVDRVNAIVDRELKEIPNIRVFDVSQGRHFTDKIDERTWTRMKGQGYIKVTTEEAASLADGTEIKVFIGRAKDFNVENLRFDQVAYRPGGHRMYRGNYFVKQTSEGVQPDTGRRFLRNPNVYIAAETRAEANFWATRMEAARQAYVRGDDLTVLDEILGGHAGLPDAQTFVKDMEAGVYDRNHKFDTYFDREMPTEYNGSEFMDYVDPDEGGFNGFLRTHGKMYTGRKGQQLTDYQGNLAPLLDPYETINRSLNNIASLSSFGDYKIESVNRWMNTFGKYLNASEELRDASDMRRFMEGTFPRGGNLADQRIIAAAEAQRTIIRRTLGWRSPRDIAAEQWTNRMMDFVAGSRVDGVLPNVRKNIVNWVQDVNPVSALRGFAFDMKLGLFNVAQLPLQLSTAVAGVALSPKNGMRGWAMIAPMRYAMGSRLLSKEAFEARLEELVKRNVHDIGGFDNAKEFKEYIRSAKRSGFFDLGGTHGLIDSYGANATIDGFAGGVKRVREAGRFFFYESERWNRMVAWRIAWDEAKEAGLKPGSPEFVRTLAGRAEEYSFNMSRESQAWWQKGLLSIPTQFWAYNARMLEAMTVGNFTKVQKLRLILSQTLLYGSAGLPVTAAISALRKSSTGESLDPFEENGDPNIEGMIDRGLLDTAVYAMTGGDVNVSIGARVGTGNFMVDLTRELFGASQYGPSSVVDMIGGATFNILGTAGKTLQPVYEYMVNEAGSEDKPLVRDSLLRVASNVSTIGNGLKAYIVFNYGIYRTNSGSTSVSDLPPETAFAIALGVAPAEMDKISAMRSYLEDKNKAADEAARIISNYRVDMLNRPDQAETIGQDVNTFVRLLPEDIRTKALARAHDRVDPSLYQSLVERFEKEKALEDGLTN